MRLGICQLIYLRRGSLGCRDGPRDFSYVKQERFDWRQGKLAPSLFTDAIPVVSNHACLAILRLPPQHVSKKPTSFSESDDLCLMLLELIQRCILRAKCLVEQAVFFFD